MMEQAIPKTLARLKGGLPTISERAEEGEVSLAELANTSHETGEVSPTGDADRVTSIPGIWASSRDGTANMSRRTAIVLTPSVPHYTTSETPDEVREARWKSRGLAPLEFTPGQAG